MKGKKGYIAILIAAVAGAIYFITRAGKKGDQLPATDPLAPVPAPTPGPGFEPPSDFPLKRGSRGSKVTELQKAIIDNRPDLLKPPADGQFGPLTEKALKAIFGKTTVDSQKELDQIKGLKSAEEATKNRIALAKQILEQWKKDKNLRIAVVENTTITTGKTDVTGRPYGEKVLRIASGYTFPFRFISRLSYSAAGMMRAEFPDSTYVLFSPYVVRLVK